MGYLTENLVAESAVFRSKVEMALTKAVNNALGGAQDAMAKAVMHDIPRYARELAPLLAIGGLNLDSTDSQIDAGITANIDWLIARTSK